MRKKCIFLLFSIVFFFSSTKVLASPNYDNDNGIYTDDFTDTTGTQTRSGVSVNGGVLQLTNSGGTFTPPYNSSGYVILKSIIPTTLAKWDILTFDATVPEGTSYKIQIVDESNTVYPDTDFPGNESGFSSTEIDVSQAPMLKYAGDVLDWNVGRLGRMRLKITMETTDTNITPTIDNLQLRWTKTQGDLSTSLIEDSSVNSHSIRTQGTNRAESSNQYIYPAFRWSNRENIGSYLDMEDLLIYNNYLVNSAFYKGSQLNLINLDTGVIATSYPFEIPFFKPIISQNGTLYISESNNDAIFAIDLMSGAIKWTHPFYSGHQRGFVIDNEGTLLMLKQDNGVGNINTLYAYNADGTVKYSQDYVNDLRESTSELILNNDMDTVYWGTTEDSFAGVGKLYSVRTSDGNLNWTYDIDNMWISDPLVGPDGTIYCGSYSWETDIAKKIFAINADGTLKWEKEIIDAGDYGVQKLALTDNALIVVDQKEWVSAPYNKIMAIDIDDGTILWESDDFLYGSYTRIVTDQNNGFYANFFNNISGDDYRVKLSYYDDEINLKWSIPYQFTRQSNGDKHYYYQFGEYILDGRGWLYGKMAYDLYDEWFSVYTDANSFTKYFALSPWTLEVSSSNGDSYIHPGDTINFTATTAMQSTNPLLGGDNAMQVVMANGDKVAMSYSSTDGDGDTVWTGSYQIPADVSDGDYSYTVEAAQTYLQTDITTNFDSPPSNSNNTGIRLEKKLQVDSTPPKFAWTDEQGRERKFEIVEPKDNQYITDELPNFCFTPAGDDVAGISKYQVYVNDNLYLDNIDPNKPEDSDHREDNNRYTYYRDNGEVICVRSKKDSDKFDKEAIQWRVRAYDHAGNMSQTVNYKLRINTKNAVFSDRYFPLTVEKINDQAVSISNLKEGSPQSHSVSVSKPSFTGISLANAKVTLQIKDLHDQLIYQTSSIVDGNSNYTISVDQSLISASYLVSLSASYEGDYVEIKEFELEVNNNSGRTYQNSRIEKKTILDKIKEAVDPKLVINNNDKTEELEQPATTSETEQKTQCTTLLCRIFSTIKNLFR